MYLNIKDKVGVCVCVVEGLYHGRQSRLQVGRWRGREGRDWKQPRDTKCEMKKMMKGRWRGGERKWERKKTGRESKPEREKQGWRKEKDKLREGKWVCAGWALQSGGQSNFHTLLPKELPSLCHQLRCTTLPGWLQDGLSLLIYFKLPRTSNIQNHSWISFQRCIQKERKINKKQQTVREKIQTFCLFLRGPPAL